MNEVSTEEPGALLVAPRLPDSQDKWLELIGTGMAGGFASGAGAALYDDMKVACGAAVKKLRDRSSEPDGEQEWVHQLVAETFIGPCPPRHKLVHLNGDRSNNSLSNLAYVPESDPRPAAPLKPRSLGWFTKAEITGRPSNSPASNTKNKKRKGKRKHH
jgi:HNH endonuclease